MTKKRRKSLSHRRCLFSERDHCPSVKKARRKHLQKASIKSQKSGASPETVAHFQALQRSPTLADVFEWLGDALLGELVGRCLLSQFHKSPLSARVFRNLWLAVVSNRNLAQVYDAMGYGPLQRRENINNRFKMKDRADVVEAVVGELVLKLHQEKTDTEKYRAHLDAVLAMMLHTHFNDRIKTMKKQDETRITAQGPLSISFNPFACLPEEQLDETTGELVVIDGVLDQDDKEEIGDEYLSHRYREAEIRSAATLHHYFADTSKVLTRNEGDILNTTSAANGVKMAMIKVNDGHILRTSSEIFQVFKIFGMAVLSERISLLLVLPHVSLGSFQHIEQFGITPASLTRQRQVVLSVANLAACAISLGIASPVARNRSTDEEEEVAVWRLQEEHGLANTLRAFVGYHSAVATASTSATNHSNGLVESICTALYDASFPIQKEYSDSVLRSPKIPDREPLMMRSVAEARMFMSSKTCDDLHRRGERPVPDAALKCDEYKTVCYLLRDCYSNKLEDLIEALNKKKKYRWKKSETASAFQTRRTKRKSNTKKLTDSFAATAGCITRNLERFLHRPFLCCLEEVVVLFAQHKTEACRAQIAAFEHDLMPCVDQHNFCKWQVSTSALTLAMRDSFFRMLLHDICQFHAIISSSRNTQDGTRITQLRLPLHYTWANINTRITQSNML